MGKHFQVEIEDGRFTWQRREESIAEEAALDGICVIRTSEPAEALSAEDAVRGRKRLANVEQAFRSLESVDLLIRPFYHRLPERIRARAFVCLLAYHVQWHMKRAWASLLFAGEDLEEHGAARDPAPPAEEVKAEKASRQDEDGDTLHDFGTLLEELSTQARNVCRIGEGEIAVEVTILPTPFQAKALELLKTACSQRR